MAKDQLTRFWRQSGCRSIIGFFIYYCDSYRQPRVKCENPLWRFELSECFLVTDIFQFV